MKLPIRRGFPFSDTVYIHGTVQGIETQFVLDTGAEKTVIAERIFNQIKSEDRPKIVRKGEISTRRWWSIKGYGEMPH